MDVSQPGRLLHVMAKTIYIRKVRVSTNGTSSLTHSGRAYSDAWAGTHKMHVYDHNRATSLMSGWG